MNRYLILGMWLVSGNALALPATAADALIFDGLGTSESNAQAIVDIVRSHGLSYRTVTSGKITDMSASELAGFGVIIWPGGDSWAMNSGLAPTARQNIRNAVINSGVNFIGFCAGAWMAVGPAPLTNAPPEWGLSIITGGYLKEYHPNGAGSSDPTAAIIKTSMPGGIFRYLLWWQGPFLPEIPGGVPARYPDGTPAIIQTYSGKGFVVLSGVHPEAPQSWRAGLGLLDPDGMDTDYAWTLIESAFNRRKLPSF